MPDTHAAEAVMTPHAGAAHAALRNGVIALTAFLTVVDLFATQAILPSLAVAYGVSPGAMGTAVNATTLGMAASSLLVALFGRQLDRRRGILLSLMLLSVPTALLATAPDLATFAALRVAQGVFMASAFTLTLAYLGEQCSAADTAGAFAAYITGNVASNLIGRVASAGLADHVGLAGNFYAFAALNLAGALLVHATIARTPPMAHDMHSGMPMGAGWLQNLRSGPLRSAFAIGFCILFAFIGTFTYVNFRLVGEPFGLGPMELGLVYFVFLPSIVTTPLAARARLRFGMRGTMVAGLAIALVGLALALSENLAALLTGLVLIGVGTFLAQATATAFVGAAAPGDRASASGMYLAAYFSGGLAGSALLGRAYGFGGWTLCVAGIALSLAAAAVLAWRIGPAMRLAMR